MPPTVNRLGHALTRPCTRQGRHSEPGSGTRPGVRARGNAIRPVTLLSPTGYGTYVGGFAAVVLAGGAARRMGGADKPTIPVAGQSMLTRVLAAVHDADPQVVVGRVPPDLPVPVASTTEQPPGGGPVAAPRSR